MHNNIMAAGSKERPPMLGPGRYSQWHSRFLRYLDTKSNGEYLRKCIFDGPYMPTNVLIAAVEAAENIPPVAAHEEAETIHNMTTENKLYFQAEKEAIFLILTGIGDEIYSTVDACNTAKEMWTAIERLQQVDKEQLASFTNASECSISSTTSTRMVKICDGCQAERGNRHSPFIFTAVLTSKHFKMKLMISVLRD
ncbi:hypothetical protein Tco_0425676 [Tanacetum coccineum]